LEGIPAVDSAVSALDSVGHPVSADLSHSFRLLCCGRDQFLAGDHCLLELDLQLTGNGYPSPVSGKPGTRKGLLGGPMKSQRFPVLVLLAGGLISLREAEEALYPPRFRGLVRLISQGLVWSGVCIVMLLLIAGAVAEANDWNPWIGVNFGFVPWNGPTLARHLHAVLWALFGGLL
jgi:hypothetical protein